MNTNYDQKLINGWPESTDNCLKNFFKLHPQYLPWVGDKYDQQEKKVLQIGESHYINQKENDPNNKFEIDYFEDKWWNDKCDDLLNYSDNFWRYDTREVIDKVLSGKVEFYSVFKKFADVFCESVIGCPDADEAELKRTYDDYIAYTEFYIMPSLYLGTNFGAAVRSSFKKIERTKRGLAGTALKDIEKKSAAVLDHIIDVLKPDKIVFTSGAAGEAYKKYGNYKDSKDVSGNDLICYTCHPKARYNLWNKNRERVVNFLKTKI